MSTHGNRAVRQRVRAAATAAAAMALIAAPLCITTTASAAEAHVDNPYAGATQYVNPTYAAAVESAATRAGDPTLAAKMRTVAKQPTAVWMDRISAINGNADGNGLKFHLDNAVAQKGSGPIVFNLVIYDLPGRDCYALASNGELPATDAGLARYKTEYIDPIAALLADPKYADIRISATIEPDSLPNLVTNISEAACQQAAPYYRAGVKYALDKLHAIPNVYNYIDIGHSGWLGWDSNAGPAATLFAEVAKSTTAGFASVDGFVSDVANTTPLNEPFLPDSSISVGGTPIRSSDFYEWNFDFDEADFTAHMHRLLVAAGFPSSLGMLIDTSRNGWGGPNRPTAVSTSTDVNTYVNQSRVDQRVHRGAWCNPMGAGIGELPQATPAGYAASHIDAFVWIKPPGESDGASSDIPNDQGKRFDRMCDPTFVSPKLENQLTGATPNAPLAGQWFEDQFRTLVANAYPVIPGSGTNPTDTTAPSVPTRLTAGTTTATTVPLSWTASTDNVAVTGYDVYRGTTLVGTSTSTSYTVTGLTAATAYSFTVRAKDAAGNVSAASTAVSATTQSGSVTDTTAPSVPTGLTAGTTTSTSVPLSWTASTDNAGGSGLAGYEVYRGSTLVGTTTSTSYTVTGLTAATAYSFTVRAKDIAGNVSAASSAVSATTQSGSVTDTTAPSVPTGLTAGTTTSTSVPLSWTASTDNVAVTGYDVYRGTTLVGTSTSTSYTVTGLTAATAYSFTVRAKDAAGNVSAASTAVSATTQPGASTGSCSVKYTANSWNNGFTASVKVTNTGTSALTGWTLGFSFANGQSVTQGWSAEWSQSGSAVTARSAAWNGTLGAGQSVDIGFNGSHSGTNNAPTAFTINGAACTVA
ncbi:glycoside hydrolase family 6 protein [Cellulomonas fengjieae]|uniref:Glucanase n=1 Tax=Cellulomonas fengjieae TaxID=2819978 RepID=A0ABS3SIZ2_9CELL|nr:glycoside hydrolase family 6 protein [Cellulomonas fengjieae]MBO3085622.1 glycoside hydrolase family 6 protein [Cellulomonas fengjieae]QVI67660.1 glycoside hydrolase family 6 protein [Cellulomonas fengjieae]